MKKENIPLVVGLAIPVLMVIALAAIIFLPRAYVQPQYDFVYSTGDYPVYINDSDNTRTEYRVVNNTIEKDVTPDQSEQRFPRYDAPPKFYRYSVAEQRSQELNSEELLSLTVDPAKESPDGFRLTYAREHDNFLEAFFGGRDRSQQVLAKGSVSIEVQLTTGAKSSNYYWRDSGFIGWIVE